MRILITFLLLAGLAMGLVITNPSREDVDAEIQSQLMVQIDQFEANADQDPTIQLIVKTCKLSRSACANFISSFVEVGFEDKLIYSKVTLTLGNKEPVTCFGALSRLVCPEL
jgi:hypothetical protein